MKSIALILAALLSASSVHAADSRPVRVQPVRSVTVKLMPAGTVPEPWKISSLTERTCTVQVDEPARMPQAFAACLSAKPERTGCRTLTFEDGSKARAAPLKGGSWDQTGCDQSKVKR
jgi:hypothetical protein